MTRPVMDGFSRRSDDPSPKVSSARRRGLATFADQAVSSLTNFGLSFLVLVSAGAADFGAFTVAYVTYALAVAVNRGFVGHPLAIRFGREAETWMEATAHGAGASFQVGIIVGLPTLFVAAFIGGDIGASLFAVGALLPLLLVQDAWRFAFFAAARPGAALLNDVVWGATLFAAITGLLVAGYDGGAATFVWIWAGAGAVAGLLGIVQTRLFPSPSGLRWWIINQRDLGVKLAIEMALAHGGRRASLYLVGAIAGLEALGFLNGARVLFGPMNVLYMGMFAFAIPEGVRLAERSIPALAKAVRLGSLALVGLSLLLGFALVNLPGALVDGLFGAEWDKLSRLVPPIAVAVAASGWVNGQRVGMRALEAATESLRAGAILVPISIAGVALGAVIDGAFGAAVGLAVVDVVSAVAWSLWFRVTVRAAVRHRAGIEHMPEGPAEEFV
jgi:O-antigen/teichoic acid export membrane protein